MVSRKLMRLIGVIWCMLLPLSMASAQGNPPQYGYSLEQVNEGSVTYSIYKFVESKSVDISDLELAPGVIGTDPLNFIYWRMPDYKLELLKKGLARLKDSANASQEYLDAEQKAKGEGLGMWYASPTPTPTASPSSTPTTTSRPTATPSATIASPSTATQPTATRSLTATTRSAPTRTLTPTPTLNSIQKLGRTITNMPWSDIVGWLAKLVLGIVGLIGGADIIQWIDQRSHRHRVLMTLMGEPSVGKTWLWTRLTDPDISEAELRKIKLSTVVNTAQATKITMGKFEIVPYLTDLPGTRPEKEIDTLLGQKKFRLLPPSLSRRKEVWLILLSTTPDSQISYQSPAAQKVDQQYVSEQLGALKTPVGFIQARSTSKPQCVLLCISKFDLFSEQEPRDSTSKEARANLELVFKNHIARVEKACHSQGIPFNVVHLSALTGAGTEDIRRYIEKALYNRKRG